MKKILFISVLLITFSTDIIAQVGRVRVFKDPKIDIVVDKQKEICSADNTIDGFRVQIFMGSGNDAPDEAREVMKAFSEEFPLVPAYLVFGQPYYRVRVGDFRTRIEAEKLHLILKEKYPKAFVTADKIQLPEIDSCKKQDESLNENPVAGETEIQEQQVTEPDATTPSDIYYEE